MRIFVSFRIRISSNSFAQTKTDSLLLDLKFSQLALKFCGNQLFSAQELETSNFSGAFNRSPNATIVSPCIYFFLSQICDIPSAPFHLEALYFKTHWPQRSGFSKSVRPVSIWPCVKFWKVSIIIIRKYFNQKFWEKSQKHQVFAAVSPSSRP